MPNLYPTDPTLQNQPKKRSLITATPMANSFSQPGVQNEDFSGLTDAAYGQQMLGQRMLEGAQVKEANDTSALLQKQSQDADKYNAELAKIYSQSAAAADNAISEYEKLSSEIQNSKIDPDRFYNSRTTSQKTGLALGLILSGIADAGIVYSGRGTPNNVERYTKIVNDSIDRDIASQESALKNKSLGQAAKMNLIGLYRQKFNDEIQAKLAAKAQMIEDNIRKAQQISISSGSTKARANAEIAVGALKAEAAKVKDALKSSVFQRSVEAARAVPQISEGQQTNLDTIDSALSSVKSLKEMYFGDKASKKEPMVGTFSGIGQHIPGSSSSDYNDAVNAAVWQVGAALKGGDLRESDVDTFKDLFPGPGSLKGSAKNKFEQIEKSLLLKKQQIVKSNRALGKNVGSANDTGTRGLNTIPGKSF